jgi:hypothetical protein
MEQTKMTARVQHDNKVTKWFLIGLALHIPIFVGQAIVSGKDLGLALFFSLFIFLPLLIFKSIENLRNFVPSFIAFGLMVYSALLIHLGAGMIEMHFHVFVSIAALVAYARWIPILVAVVTIAVHHIAFYFLLPKSIFNYEASFGIVLLHALFVIVEAIPALFIANQFRKQIELQDGVISELDNVSTEVDENSNSLTHVSEQLSQITMSLASSLEETNAALEELTASSRLTKDYVDQSWKKTNTSSEKVGVGLDSSNHIATRMRQLVQQSDKISEITDVIDDIAFQTNLLALNAAVEAARAGEQGRGFAVVAEAVRSLAQKSQVAAKEISELIRVSLQEIEGASKESLNLQKELQDTKGELVALVTTMTEMRAMFDEQLQGYMQISQTIQNIDQSSQESHVHGAQVAEMAQNLKARASALDSMVKKLSAA